MPAEAGSGHSGKLRTAGPRHLGWTTPRRRYLRGSPGAAAARFAESLGLARRLRMKASTAYALLGLAVASRPRPDLGRSNHPGLR